MFTEYPPQTDRSKIIQSLQRVALISKEEAEGLRNAEGIQNTDGLPNANGLANVKDEPKISSAQVAFSSNDSDIKVESTNAGIRLTIQNLQFKPDSAELLPGEEQRLDKIAQVLKEAGNNQFLVEGHSADTGFEKGEMKVSAERAHAIAEALSRRGISASRFITKGSGAHKPIADNSTPEGRAINRRVEITILE